MAGLDAAEVLTVPVLFRIKPVHGNEGHPRPGQTDQAPVPQSIVHTLLVFRRKIRREDPKDLVRRIDQQGGVLVLPEQDGFVRNDVPFPERTNVFTQRVRTCDFHYFLPYFPEKSGSGIVH